MREIVKDWLSYEQDRNKASAALYERILHLCFGKGLAVLVGHHVGFEFDGDFETENEIPSADTLIFDHYIMEKVFGSKYVAIMADLASIPADRRDTRLKYHLELMYGLDPKHTKPTSGGN